MDSLHAGASDASGPTDITGQVVKLDQYAFASGGFADVWRGKWQSSDGRNRAVAIKIIRSFDLDLETEEKMQTKLKKETHIWSSLHHDHIVPLHGVVRDFGRFESMVSPLMAKGNASKYFEGQDVQETIPARFKLLCEVASGLQYLHSFCPTIIHGDLKASNILIDEHGSAMLSDFGISTIIEEVTGTTRYTTTSFAGSVRWMAFELLQFEAGTPQLTTYADVWSFASTALEVLSGKVPYHDLKTDAQVLRAIISGVKPGRDANVSEEVWSFLQTCWGEDPSSRPSMSFVKNALNSLRRVAGSTDYEPEEIGRRSPMMYSNVAQTIKVAPQSVVSTPFPPAKLSESDFDVIVLIKNLGERYVILSIYCDDQVVFEGSFVPNFARGLPLKINTPYYFELECGRQSKGISRVFTCDQDLDLDMLFSLS